MGSSIQALFRSDVASIGPPLRERLHRLWSQGLPPDEVARLQSSIQVLASGALILHLEAASAIVEGVRRGVEEVRARTQPPPAARLDAILSGLDFLDRLCQVGDADLARWLDERAAEARELVASLGAFERRITVPPLAAPHVTNPELSLLGLFRQDLRAQLPSFHAGLDALGSPDAGPALAPLLRAAHSIRGAAAVARVEVVERLARAMEQALATAHEGHRQLGPEAPELFRRVVALFERLAQLDDAALAAADDPEQRELLAALDPVAGRAVAAGPETAAPAGGRGAAPHDAEQLGPLVAAAREVVAWGRALEGDGALAARGRALADRLRAALRPLVPSILVVDDSATVRELERKLLVDHGYHVELAGDGAAGWDAVRERHFDLVISDVDMPRMNGLDFVNHVRGVPELRGLPIIIVSSYRDREDDRRRAMAAGADACLPKSSVHDDRLLAEVARLLGASR